MKIIALYVILFSLFFAFVIFGGAIAQWILYFVGCFFVGYNIPEVAEYLALKLE
jgi:hypothetical protein